MLPFGLSEPFSRLPTTDLYLVNPLAALKERDPSVATQRLRNLAPNVYLIGATGVIVRYGKPADIDRLRRAGAKRIVYIADDDFTAGAGDTNLPEPYRRRLAEFAAKDWPALRDAADVVVVPGSVLADMYGAKARIVPPIWHHPPASSDHFADARRIEIAHLGTGSHRVDLTELAPLLSDILDKYPRAHLTVFSGIATPRPLRTHARVRVRDAKGWWRYKRALPRMRFHLALYPLADTAFNRARSANKFYEHALIGAASLMSPNPALRAAAGPSLAGIFVEDGLEAWRERIDAMLGSLPAMRKQAEAVRAHIVESDPAAHAAAVWREILGS